MRILCLLSLLIICGCITEKSVKHKVPYSQYLGKKLITSEVFFIVEEGNKYFLMGEERLVKGQDPTFEQFEAGEWNNSFFRTTKFVAILPKGITLEVIDIKERFHIEVGTTLRWFIRPLSDEHSEFSPIILSRSDLAYKFGFDELKRY